MKKIISVRKITEEEEAQIRAGLRSQDGFVLRRCQIILASQRGDKAQVIADNLGCDDETVFKVIKGFNHKGLGILKKGSKRPHKIQYKFTPEAGEQLKEILHQSPRDFGKDTSQWTLAIAAEVSFENGLIETEVSTETIRNVLKRLNVKWSRAKHWITSPDPEYEQKKSVKNGSSRV